MSDWNENKQYHEEHKKNLLSTLGYNKTIIWITVIFFIVSLILSAIFVYLPVYRIENEVKLLSAFVVDELEQAKLRFDRITTFIDKIEPEVDLIITGVKDAIKEACEAGVIRDPKICAQFGALLPVESSGGSTNPVGGGGANTSSNSSVSLFNTRSF